ncbi:MBL fold metallo-hydrolase [Phaeobacter piscinae]|uniref:MBL fold metallo-hydrolase n=1 Tax=Phaeobacter piscinae TaxID=1580596 RepID=UPI000C998319|nr:MBL fold metallo-hydrolase [Phaeobacter piscinae]AUQ74578.1 Zn-dependent hydrolase [Phaeobacter piscinae]
MTLSRRHLLGGLAAAPVATLASPSLLRAASHSAAESATPDLPVAYHSFQIGSARVTALLDGHFLLNTNQINGFDQAEADAVLDGTFYRIKDDQMSLPVNGYLVEQGEAVTLIDAGTADLFGPILGGLEAALRAAGRTPEEITSVVVTHLHPDHIGGLLKGDGTARFPNAEIVVGQGEYDFWHDDAVYAGVPQDARGFFDIARAAVAPYQDRLKMFEGEADVMNGLRSVPLPGHTPGHCGFLLETGAAPLLIWGDLIHSTALQFARPDWTLAFDMDPEQTVKSRTMMLDRAASEGLLVTGMHLDFPGLGRVARDGDAYGFDQAPWQFSL